LLAAASLAALPCVAAAAVNSPAIAITGAHRGGHRSASVSPGGATATPIKHLVVIFGENVSFDHYFGTYPDAANPKGEPAFTARAGTPAVNGLRSAGLLVRNPNSDNPQRLGPKQAVTCDQDHGYTAEQQAFDSGLMDRFVQFTDSGDCAAKNAGEFYEPGLVMDYYDGNTVTALWNYAQRFAMSDNSYNTTFGPSTPGALNLVSGQTHGVISIDPSTGKQTTAPDSYTVADPDAHGVGTVINDPDPAYDDCSSPRYARAAMQGSNIGDLLNAKQVTWGWFEGGFRPSTRTDGTAVCGAAHANLAGASTSDYIAHHEPFQYYRSTANPHHLPPTSVAMIGRTDQANHQYDLTDFWKAADAGNLPAVSFLKAAGYQDGHAGYSDPIDEQHFLVDTLNRLQKLPAWKDTAVVLAYDDSDGWYDHVSAPIVNMSATSHDALTGAGSCGSPTARTRLGGYSDRCGYGPRLPLLVLSPYARSNYVDHTITDQSSILKFIEDNWKTGQIGDGSFDAVAGSLDAMFDFHARPDTRRLFLDTNGEPLGHRH
jgi:phospholipase C